MPLGPFTAKEHWEIASLGTEFAVTVALGTLLGYWLDKKYSSTPWLLIAGALGGFALGLYNLIRRATTGQKKK